MENEEKIEEKTAEDIIEPVEIVEISDLSGDDFIGLEEDHEPEEDRPCIPPDGWPDSEVLSKIEDLRELFVRKIEEDEHKDQLFDNMHRELTRFQNDAYEKPIISMALDIIQIIDSIRKDHAFYSNGEITEERYQKLLKCVLSIAQELEDALYRHEIEAYTVADDAVDTKKQKILSVIETDNPELTGMVAERLASGYERNGKVIRPERIKAYKVVVKNTENE